MKNFCKRKFFRLFVSVSGLLISFVILLSGCGGGGGGGGGGTSTQQLNEPITSSYIAGNCIGYIHSAVAEGSTGAEDVLNSLGKGTFSGRVINCITGTATVTGTQDWQTGISCGSSCVRSTYDVNVTIVFNNCNWKNFSNGNITFNGTIKYESHSWSQQNGLSYSSSDSHQMNNVGSSVQFTQVIQGYNSSYGYKDTITFNASGSNPYLLYGTLTAQNGVTYSF